MDQAGEDLIDTDTAVGWMEEVTFLIGRLAPGDRRELLALVQRLQTRRPMSAGEALTWRSSRDTV